MRKKDIRKKVPLHEAELALFDMRPSSKDSDDSHRGTYDDITQR